jgi:hypothetical protein
MNTPKIRAISWILLSFFFHFNVAAEQTKAASILGKFEKEKRPDEVSLHSIKNGATLVHSTVKVAEDGTFGFLFKPTYSGFYTIGEGGAAARLFLTPGRSVELTIRESGYEVNADDKENTALATWAKTLWPLKKTNQLRGMHTYKEVFPILPGLEKSTKEAVSNLEGLALEFQALFSKLVTAEFEYEVLHFLYMPRTTHPKKENRPEIYQRLAKAPRFQDDSTLQFDF